MKNKITLLGPLSSKNVIICLQNPDDIVTACVLNIYVTIESLVFQVKP